MDREGLVDYLARAGAESGGAYANGPLLIDRFLDAAIETVEGLTEFTTAALEGSLRARIVDEMGVKPRLAFGPLRVAVTGRQVSPPLFESMEILGRDSSLTRLRALRASLA